MPQMEAMMPPAEGRQPTLFLICGLPGAGKTTLSLEIEAACREAARPALRLCPDEWISRLLADASDQPELDRLRLPVEAVQWGVAVRLLALGIDVILDWGFWSEAQRRECRAEAEAIGARVELRCLEAGREELWQRIARRNADLPPGMFVVTREQLDLWWTWFQPPGPDELEGYH